MSIKVENLTHIYSKDTPFEKIALNNISFEIKDNDFVAIIGHTVNLNQLVYTLWVI